MATWGGEQRTCQGRDKGNSLFLEYEYGGGHPIGIKNKYDCSGLVNTFLAVVMGHEPVERSTADWKEVCTLDTLPGPGSLYVGWREGHVGIVCAFSATKMLTLEAAGGDRTRGGLDSDTGCGFRSRSPDWFTRFWAIPAPAPGSLFAAMLAAVSARPSSAPAGGSSSGAAAAAAASGASSGASSGSSAGASLRPKGGSLR